MDDKQAIEEVVKKYRDGSNVCDAELLSSVFLDGALVSGFVGEKDLYIPADKFVEVVCSGEEPSPEANGCDFRCVPTDIQIDGPMAHCRFEEFDDNGTDYITYFQLMKVAGEWKVISKLFQVV